MNSTLDDQITGGHNLDEPHFDEEATILAAQPVVPLDEVRAEKRSKAGVAVALAIAGGLLIGLLAATLIYRYLGAGQVPRGETATVTEQPAGPDAEQTSNQLPSPVGGAVGVNDSAVTSAEDQTPVEAEAREGQLDEEPGRVPEVAPRRPVVVRESRPPVDEEEDEEAERALRRAERQEERRERRRAIREARRQDRQPDRRADDLTRIREIFEGAPKP